MGLKGKMLIAQGGGPTAVINQSFVGAVLEARDNPNITHIYGALHGVEGIVNEEFVELDFETNENLEKVAMTPASALMSTRVKPDEAYCEKMFKVLRSHDIRYFFYIGGNDSSDTVRIVKQYAEKNDYELVAIHIPKTIDNDLMENDHTPGFGSAARFVTQAIMGVNQDNRALNGVYIAIVMGRHAGFLTASSVLAKVFPDDGPHLIYLPERHFSIPRFLDDVKAVYEKYGRCVAVLSEGIQDEEGVPIVTKLIGTEKDQHGNIQLSGNGALGDLLVNEVKNILNIKRVRSDTFGYLQRSFAGVVSDVDAREAREAGQVAARYATHEKSGSVAIKRVGDYAVEYQLVDLSLVAAKTKVMDPSFINEAGNFVTDAFVDYVKPLVGTDLPVVARLTAPLVEKVNKE
ncbi:6-phosphofructokinase [Guggenheimella bovis]